MAHDRSEAQRREARRYVRGVIDDAFARQGLPARKWPANWPELAPLPPPAATPGEPIKIWLGTFEIAPGVGALMIPAGVAIEDAADVILEASFQQDQAARAAAEAPEPPIIWTDEDAPHE
jgi:hypothetical protein